MMRVLYIIVLLLNTLGLQAQKVTGNAYVSKMMNRIPDSLTFSTDKIAAYINSTFSTQTDKSRAVFIWIARNVAYNFDSIITNSLEETPSEISERILKTRTGVCLNIAHLFNEISNKSGIKSYIIHGYTKQQGRIDFLPHVWCASFIDTAWYLFDPTWGSGFYSRGRYISQVSGQYFKVKPEVLIHTHIPFDPLWQFLHYPVTHTEFSGKFRPRKVQKPYFNFRDTLNSWENTSELERAERSVVRVEQAGITNNFVAAKVRVLHGEIEYLQNKMAAEKYDSSVSKYNKGIHTMNQYINYRNNLFNSEPDTLLMSNLLDSADDHFAHALENLEGLQAREKNITSSIVTLKNHIRETQMKLNLQRSSLKEYLTNR